MSIAGAKGTPPCAEPDQDSRRWTNPTDHDEVRYASGLCRTRCPEAEACLIGAVERRDYGVWGGLLLNDGKPTTKIYPTTFSEGRDDIEHLDSVLKAKTDRIAAHIAERNAQVARSRVVTQKRRREIARFTEHESRQLVSYLAHLTVKKTAFHTEPHGDEIVVYTAA